jgi:hypothetical protein
VHFVRPPTVRSLFGRIENGIEGTIDLQTCCSAVVVKLDSFRKFQARKGANSKETPESEFWRGDFVTHHRTKFPAHLRFSTSKIVNEAPVASVEALGILGIISSSNRDVESTSAHVSESSEECLAIPACPQLRQFLTQRSIVQTRRGALLLAR